MNRSERRYAARHQPIVSEIDRAAKIWIEDRIKRVALGEKVSLDPQDFLREYKWQRQKTILATK